MLALPVRTGTPKGLGGLVDDVITPAFATPLGLILYGSRKEHVPTGSSFAQRFKFPARGMAGKLIETIRDLLP
jgi:cell division protein FtsA